MDPDCLRKEFGDVNVAILNLAGSLGVDVDAATREVMDLIVARGREGSMARAMRKRAMGLVGSDDVPGAPPR